jgi:small nuclear ribonucleoprotein (snRNP)-like protein
MECEGKDNGANGGVVVGVLKGFDQLMNLVLDEVQEYMRGELPAKG